MIAPTIKEQPPHNHEIDRQRRRRANVERIEIAAEMLSKVRADLESLGSSLDQQTADLLDSLLLLAADVRLIANTEAGSHSLLPFGTVRVIRELRNELRNGGGR